MHVSAILRIDVDLDELRDESIDEQNESRDESARVKRWIVRQIDMSRKINRNAS